MTMTTTHAGHDARRICNDIVSPLIASGHARMTWIGWCRASLLTIAAYLLMAGWAFAANELQDLNYTALPGGKIEIRMKFAAPLAVPQGFTTDTPPTIALDFADTHNGLSKRRTEIGAGATSAVTAIEAGGRTRVVISLFRAASYKTAISGNSIVVTVNNGLGETTNVAAAAAIGNPTKALPTRGNEITNVDFRRGKNGEGRVVISFSQSGAAVDLKREGERIVLDMLNVGLPSAQAKRLDVIDFATPVQSIESRSRGNGVRTEIIATKPFEQLAYQTGNDYIVEVTPKREDAKAAGKNAPPTYSGERVTFNFQDIPARSVLQLLADVSNINIVVADNVSGNLTLRLINVPWDQALDLVLQAKNLDKRRQGNVIWVGPQKDIADREQALAEARMKREEQDELVSDFIPISYGSAKDIAALLTKDAQTNQAATAGGSSTSTNQQRGFLSPRGSVTWDERTNTLLVSDVPAKIVEIRQLVATLDKPVQQVLIESRIVVATDTFARELGAKFGVSGGYEDNNGNVITTSGSAAATNVLALNALQNRLSGSGSALPIFGVNGPTGGVAVPVQDNRLNVNLPATNLTAGRFGLAILGADYLLDLELSAAQSEGRTEVISTPRVVTANNTEAIIKQGSEIGYQSVTGTGADTTPTVLFKEVVLELKVTPTISADDRIYLNLSVKKDALASFFAGANGSQIPQIDKREVTSKVLVDNGQTVVLGGVYEINKSDTTRKVPFLGDIPVLGNLFRNNARHETKGELLIFVTPRILNESLK